MPTSPTPRSSSRSPASEPVRERVEQLLGMDFHAFCRSVLLAQNRFADFLDGDAARSERGAEGRLRLRAVRRRPRGGQAPHGRCARCCWSRSSGRDRSSSAAREQLEVAERRLEASRARASAVEAARAPYEEAVRAATDAERRRRDAEAARARSRDVASKLPAADDVEQVAREAREAESAVERAVEAADLAEAARADAEAARAAVAERVGDQTAFAALVTEHEHLVNGAERAAQMRDRVASAALEAADALERLVTAHEEAVRSLDEATRTLEGAGRAVAEADLALHAARHADMARTLRTELVAGEPCPVCEQSVATVPAAGRAPAIAGGERALERARRAEAKARAAHQRGGRRPRCRRGAARIGPRPPAGTHARGRARRRGAPRGGRRARRGPERAGRPAGRGRPSGAARGAEPRAGRSHRPPLSGRRPRRTRRVPRSSGPGATATIAALAWPRSRTGSPRSGACSARRVRWPLWPPPCTPRSWKPAKPSSRATSGPRRRWLAAQRTTWNGGRHDARGA